MRLARNTTDSRWKLSILDCDVVLPSGVRCQWAPSPWCWVHEDFFAEKSLLAFLLVAAESIVPAPSQPDTGCYSVKEYLDGAEHRARAGSGRLLCFLRRLALEYGALERRRSI